MKENSLDVKCLASLQVETGANIIYSVFDELNPLQTDSNDIIDLYVNIASQDEI